MGKQIIIISFPPELDRVATRDIHGYLYKSDKYKKYEIGVNDYTDYYAAIQQQIKDRDEEIEGLRGILEHVVNFSDQDISKQEWLMVSMRKALADTGGKEEL